MRSLPPPVGERAGDRKNAEIARRYCQIINEYGPHSPQVHRASVVMSVAAADSEVLRELEALLGDGVDVRR